MSLIVIRTHEYIYTCLVYVYLSKFHFEVKVSKGSIEETYQGWEGGGKGRLKGEEGKVGGLQNYSDNFYFQLSNIWMFQLRHTPHMDKLDLT